MDTQSLAGLRVLLVASTDVPVDTEVDGLEAPGNLVPRALIALEQRVRVDARDTLDFFDSQGVAVKVISGDNAVSVGAVVVRYVREALGDPRTVPEDDPVRDDPAGTPPGPATA